MCKIFGLRKDGAGYLYSYIGNDLGLQLDNNGKLIIKGFSKDFQG